jgi:hypothetical protein
LNAFASPGVSADAPCITHTTVSHDVRCIDETLT